jgi:hypothetical protein
MPKASVPWPDAVPVDGNVIVFDVPGAGTAKNQGTLANATNVEGVTTGAYTDSSGVAHGFVRSPDGNFTSFDAPGAGTAATQGTTAISIDDASVVMGTYVDSNGASHGFLRIPGYGY